MAHVPFIVHAALLDPSNRWSGGCGSVGASRGIVQLPIMHSYSRLDRGSDAGVTMADRASQVRESQLLSIVLPVHNERENLAPLFAEIAGAFGDVPYEIVAVDDGSTDGSLQELERLAGQFNRVRVVSCERRTGQSAAIFAGVDAAAGEWILTMDSDGQNDPADGRRLVRTLADTGRATVVIGRRLQRVDGWWKRVQSRVANAFRNAITGESVRDTGCSLRVMRRSALLQLPRFDGMHRFLPTLLRTLGEHVLEVDVAHRRRLYGQSKYGMWDRLGVGLLGVIRVRGLVKTHRQVGPRRAGTPPKKEVY